jgi:hypothetical protein
MKRNRRKLLITLVLTGLALVAIALVAGSSSWDRCGCQKPSIDIDDSKFEFGKDFQSNWSTVTVTATLNNVMDMHEAGVGNGAGSNYTGPLINVYQNGSIGVTTTVDQKNDFLANWGNYDWAYDN